MPNPDACPRCGGPGRPIDRSEILNCPPEDRPEPQLPGYLMPVYASHSQLGADQNGKPLLSEQREWLDAYGISDPSERRTWMALWNVVSAAKLTEARRKLDEMRSDT